MLLIREWDYKDNDQKNGCIFFHKKKDNIKVNLEIGSGNGLFLTTIAAMRKDESFFGLERLAKCINKTVKKSEKQKIENIILINGDIFTALDRFFDKDYFDHIYINFPDPWFKRRHLKKRVVQDVMTAKYYEYLKDGGRLYFVTDNKEYRDDGIRSLLNKFKPVYDNPYYSSSLPDYPVSLYEEKWKKQDREIFYSIFEKNNSSKN